MANRYPASRCVVALFCLTNLSAQTAVNVSKVVGAYCSGCHNGRMRSPSGVLLDQFDAARISANPDVWSRVYRQLQRARCRPSVRPGPIARHMTVCSP
jgi:hypothetical protein